MSLVALNTVESGHAASLKWQDNAFLQKLLDVLVSILVNEYVETVKKTPALFSNIGDTK